MINSFLALANRGLIFFSVCVLFVASSLLVISSNVQAQQNIEESLPSIVYLLLEQDDDIVDDVVIGLDPTKFFADGLAADITEESCTLSNDIETTCYRIETTGLPGGDDGIGDFCPENTNTTAANAGVWIDDGELHDLTGLFIQNLSIFYNDTNWNLLLDDDFTVKITDTQTSCEAAAVVNVAEQYNNYCVECDINYYTDIVGGSYLIPKVPVPRSTAGDIGQEGVGVALNGIKIDAAAPTEVILSAYTIAAFDDCVGHVNPVAGYHYHGANGCSEGAEEEDGHGAIFGYALDGYPIHAMLNTAGEEETDLDTCRGHTDDLRGYHYHTAGAGENYFIGCFSGEIVESTDTTPGGGGGPGGPPGM